MPLNKTSLLWKPKKIQEHSKKLKALYVSSDIKGLHQIACLKLLVLGTDNNAFINVNLIVLKKIKLLQDRYVWNCAEETKLSSKYSHILVEVIVCRILPGIISAGAVDFTRFTVFW